MGSLRGLRGRWIGLASGIVSVAVVIALSASPPIGRRELPGASPTRSSAPVASGPVVYYEVLDADASRLMERRLDGRSLAREVAVRTDVDDGRTWTVDPTGTTAIAMIPGSDDQELQAVSIATGAPIWSIRTPTAPVDQGAWSADGGWLGIASMGGDIAPREALVIETATGRFARVTIPDDAVVQGFDRDAGLILRQHVPVADGAVARWRFLRVDRDAATLERLAAPPNVGPASDWSEDVDPAVGLAVDTSIGAGGQGTAVRLWTLPDGPVRTLATIPSVDRIAFDPSGTGVAISAEQSIRFVARDGRASNLFTSADPIGDFEWSAGGDYLAIATDRHGPNLTILERATGRLVQLPHPDAVAQLLLVRIVGGRPLPVTALPAVEPTPSPTAAPSGADVAGSAGLLSAWIERSGGVEVAHVERLVPTVAGGLRVAAAMPPIDLGQAAVPEAGEPDLRLLPRPGSNDVLVWVGTSDRSAGWLWDGADDVHVLQLPADWPVDAADVAWRPDGLAIAATSTRATRGGELQGIFVTATFSDRLTTVLPATRGYDRLEGWWSTTELQVGHGICTEGCRDRFSWSARLRIRDHRLIDLSAADRGHHPIDVVTVDGSAIVLSVINDDPASDVVLDWPVDLGPTDGLEVQFAADGRSLIVGRTSASGTDLYRIADPIGRAVDGRLHDPRPELLLHLDGRNLEPDVSPDGFWVTVADRVGNVRLMRLSDGRSWPVDRERTLAWPATGAPGAG
jgi:hypothetical protein